MIALRQLRFSEDVISTACCLQVKYLKDLQLDASCLLLGVFTPKLATHIYSLPLPELKTLPYILFQKCVRGRCLSVIQIDVAYGIQHVVRS